MNEKNNDYKKLEKWKNLIGVQHEDIERGYIGQLKGNVPNGFGTLYELPNIWDNNKEPYLIYKGFFKEGEYHGWGILYFEGNPTQAGEFINGKLNGYVKILSDAPKNVTGFYMNGETMFFESDGHIQIINEKLDDEMTSGQLDSSPIEPKDGAGIR